MIFCAWLLIVKEQRFYGCSFLVLSSYAFGLTAVSWRVLYLSHFLHANSNVNWHCLNRKCSNTNWNLSSMMRMRKKTTSQKNNYDVDFLSQQPSCWLQELQLPQMYLHQQHLATLNASKDPTIHHSDRVDQPREQLQHI